MADLDLDKVLDALSEGGGIKQNSDSLLGLAKEVNTVLNEFEKTLKMLENMHVLPAIIRGVGKKYDIDVDSPLVSASNGTVPTTNYHRMVYERLNGMTAEQIGEVLLHGSEKSINPTNGNKEPDTKNG